MANTILEKLQEKYHNSEGIDDARNIAEALACATNSGGRGAGAIADHLGEAVLLIYNRNGATGSNRTFNHLAAAPISLLKDPCTKFGWAAPAGKIFAGWGTTSDATTPLTDPVYAKDLPSGATLYAIWKDAE